jgi:cell division control protein 6
MPTDETEDPGGTPGGSDEDQSTQADLSSTTGNTTSDGDTADEKVTASTETTSDGSGSDGETSNETTSDGETANGTRSDGTITDGTSREPTDGTTREPTDGTPEDSTDRSQSIEDMLLEFDEQNRLIRDRALLDPTHVVAEDRIVGRDEQLQEVTKMLRVALGDNRPPNLFLYGPSGTGKSLITKAVCNNISRICETRDIRFGTIEVNCQDLDTLGVAVYELASRAAEEAEVEIEVPKHGVATKEKWDELYRIVNENFDSAVFVLDELDMLVGRRDKKEPAFSRLLYQLSRAGANDELTAHVSVVAISNDTKMMESVGSRALSSFTPEDVHFDDYDANQLQAILHRRKDAFFEDVVDDDVIPLAAAFAAQTHGDARKAIDLMRVAGELAEREGDSRVREGHVRAAQDKVEKNRVLEVVRGISTQKKLCLYATAAVAAATDDGAARSTTGYRVYQFLTDSIDADQYHQETYVNKMKELTTYSLVEFERRSHGPSSGMFLEFRFAERPQTILETLREDSRIDVVAQDEVESVVNAQLRRQG